jgi:hypothetical protein
MIYRNNIGAYISLVKKILLSAILTILICKIASAQNSPFPLKKDDWSSTVKKQIEQQFNFFDGNKDGKITLEEFIVPALKDAMIRFEIADTNKDGIVTLDEENAAVAKAKKQEADARKKQAEQKKDPVPKK